MQRQKILVVDDEPDICQLIRRYAEHDGFETIGVSDGIEAVELCRKQDFDIIIMDIMMPEMDGFTACKKIREIKDIPVLMLSARGAEYDKLYGFEVGVDDYMVKPFSPKELMARVNVIIKRHSGSSGIPDKKDSILEFGKEYDLLLYLARHKGIVLSRDQILNAVWGYDSFGYDRTVDWQVKLLRSKLGKYRDMIQTIRGVGYKFEVSG